AGGALSTTGALDFMFTRKGVFKLPAENINLGELELELIDFGAEDIQVEDNEIIVYTEFSDFARMQKALEEKNIAVTSAEMERIPNTTTELTEEQAEPIMELIEKLEEDDDVQSVFHNIR